MIRSFKQNALCLCCKNHKAKTTGTPADKLGLAELKHLWLDSRGGRTEADVLKDTRGEYVLIGKMGKAQRVYIPKDLKVHKNSIKQYRLDSEKRASRM